MDSLRVADFLHGEQGAGDHFHKEIGNEHHDHRHDRDHVIVVERVLALVFLMIENRPATLLAPAFQPCGFKCMTTLALHHFGCQGFLHDVFLVF